MKWGVVVFPGSNDDRDTLYALSLVAPDDQVLALWHRDETLRGVDAVVLPGGFSYGDYLRCGAMARFSPVMRAVRDFAGRGGPVLGICNGFQILCESGLLPGALLRNRDLLFSCAIPKVRVENSSSAFTSALSPGEILEIPIKNGEGCYAADAETLQRIEGEGLVTFRYADGAPNGSINDIAGICNPRGNVVGLMPHPEHAVDLLLSPGHGRGLFESAREALAQSGTGGVA